MKYSRQRNLIFDIVRNTRSHPTAEWVYEQAKLLLPAIGIATVYRNLNALTQMGQLKKIVSPDGTVRFDAATEEHYHMQCRTCGRLFDLAVADQKAFAGLKDMAARAFGMEPGEAALADTLFSGVCPYCAGKEVKEDNDNKENKENEEE